MSEKTPFHEMFFVTFLFTNYSHINNLEIGQRITGCFSRLIGMNSQILLKIFVDTNMDVFIAYIDFEEVIDSGNDLEFY